MLARRRGLGEGYDVKAVSTRQDGAVLRNSTSFCKIKMYKYNPKSFIKYASYRDRAKSRKRLLEVSESSSGRFRSAKGGVRLATNHKGKGGRALRRRQRAFPAGLVEVAKGCSSRFTQQALAGSRSRVEGARRNPIVEIGEFRRGDGVRKNRAKGSEGRLVRCLPAGNRRSGDSNNSRNRGADISGGGFSSGHVPEFSGHQGGHVRKGTLNGSAF